MKDLEWQRVGNEKDNKTNQESNIGAPAPRANSAGCVYNGKIYIFGGHGGLNYSRIAFNDLYSFDLETETWEKILPSNDPPKEGRGGHSVFASDEKIYIYGGWNSEMAFTKEEAIEQAIFKYGHPDTQEMLQVDTTTFRVSTTVDHRNLMSMFN